MKQKVLKYITFKCIVYTGLILSMAALCTIGYLYWSTQRHMFDRVEREANQVLHSSVEHMDDKFKLLKQIGDRISEDVTSDKLTTKDEVVQRIRSVAQQYPGVFGVGVAFEPYAFDEDQRLYAPYITEGESKEEIYKPLQEQYDYTQADWYQKAIRSGPYWMEPLYGKAAGTRVVDYVAPFYAGSRDQDQEHVRGVVYLDYSLERVSDLLEKLQIGETGYGFIISKSGKLVAHPDERFLQQEYTIMDLAQAYDSHALSQIGHDILDKGKTSGSYDYVDPLSGKPSLLFFTKMPLTQWVFCVNFVKDEVAPEQLSVLYHYMMWLVVASVACGVMGASSFSSIWHGHPRHLVHWSVIVSIIFLCGIGTLWYLQLYVKRPQPDRGIAISSVTGLQRFLRNTSPDLNRIPTGIQLSYFAFDDMNTVKLVGSLWQRYPSQIPQKSRHFFFLQGIFDERFMQQQYTDREDELRKWHFNARVHQDFRYHEFPFDYKHVHIPIVLEQYTDRYLLTPDFDGYSVMTPSALPGMSKKLTLANWQIISSYFSYEPVSDLYQRIAQDRDASQSYNLYYNFIVRRVFLYHLMSYALPLLVGLLAIFFTLVSMLPPAQVSSPPHIKETLGPLGMFISVVFVLVTIHVSLRGFMSGQPIFYLEYFYLLGYALILAALWISHNVVFGSKRAFIVYQNGIIPKALYWPSWLLGLFIVTIITFYN